MGQILVIDDEWPGLKDALELTLDHHVLFFAAGGRRGVAVLKERPDMDCVLLDLNMPADFGSQPRQEGMAVLKEIRAARPDLPVVMLTALPEAESAARALELGAFHYLTKPLDVNRLRTIVSAAIANHELRARLRVAESAIRERDRAEAVPPEQAAGLGRLIGASRAMNAVYAKIQRIAPRDISVLVLGASGAGKELAAREIHDRSPRVRQAFVAVNCASIPSELLESTLFGHKKGAFTGAVEDRVGDFVQADHGTLFLDEIGDMPLELQAKLLRALQDKLVRPVGARDYRPVDVRIISATNHDIDALVAQGKFRNDLFYRLNVFRIHLPALVERREDIPLLAQHFLDKHRQALKSPAERLDPAALELLKSHSWPGNVRELEHAIESALAMAETPTLLAEHFRPLLSATGSNGLGPRSIESLWPEILAGRTPKSLLEFRNRYGEESLRQAIERAVEVGGNARSAARILGFLSESSDQRGYDNFRQWMSRLGVRVRGKA